LTPQDETASPEKLYSFPVKFGDSNKRYDGLVGYWKAFEGKDLIDGDALDFKPMYTYYTDKNSLPADPELIKEITTEEYVQLTP
jgi:hypothetical protein